MRDAVPIRFVTLCSRNYLPRAAVLAESLRAHDPDAQITCYLVERDTRPDDTCDGLLNVRGVTELGIAGAERLFFQYSLFELCCALKPFCMLDQLARTPGATVVYVDADMYACGPLAGVITETLENADIAVTPHLLDPEMDTDQIYFLRSGIYNAGFVAVRDTPNAHAMLTWWRDRLRTHCYDDVLGGVHLDQSWLELACANFPGVTRVSHHGVNVGHWNLHACQIRQDGDRIMVGDEEPLLLFHFSSFAHPGLTHHLTVLDAVPDPINALAATYQDAITRVTEKRPDPPPYTFGSFDDGVPIKPEHREVVRREIVVTDTPFADRKTIDAALPIEDPGSVMDTRVQHRVYRLEERCRTLEAERDGACEELQRARRQMQRIRNHPVIGRLIRLWNKLLNRDL